MFKIRFSPLSLMVILAVFCFSTQAMDIDSYEELMDVDNSDIISGDQGQAGENFYPVQVVCGQSGTVILEAWKERAFVPEKYEVALIPFDGREIVYIIKNYRDNSTEFLFAESSARKEWIRPMNATELRELRGQFIPVPTSPQYLVPLPDVELINSATLGQKVQESTFSSSTEQRDESKKLKKRVKTVRKKHTKKQKK